MTKSRSHFDDLLAKWKANEETLNKIQDRQAELVEDINECFARVITEEQLLANMDWLFEVWPRGSAELSCRVTDEKVMEFLDLLHWERIGWHHAIKMGEHYVHINDNDMSISLDSVDDMIEFCRVQGIKPNMTKLNDQRSAHQEKADYYHQIINKLAK